MEGELSDGIRVTNKYFDEIRLMNILQDNIRFTIGKRVSCFFHMERESVCVFVCVMCVMCVMC